MTRKAPINSAQLTLMAKVARKMGVMIEYVREDGIVIRVSPTAANPTPTPSKRESETVRDCRSTGTGGYPIVDDPQSAVQQWYDELGFDPRTMGQADMDRLQGEAHDRWAAVLVSKPLGKREQTALKELSTHGQGARIAASAVKNCGDDTVDRLKARGFIDIYPHDKFPKQTGYFELTAAGHKAWQKITGASIPQ